MLQLDQYRRWQDVGFITLLGSGAKLGTYLHGWTPEDPGPLSVTLLIEGTDPLETVVLPSSAPRQTEAGVV